MQYVVQQTVAPQTVSHEVSNAQRIERIVEALNEAFENSWLKTKKGFLPPAVPPLDLLRLAGEFANSVIAHDWSGAPSENEHAALEQFVEHIQGRVSDAVKQLDEIKASLRIPSFFVRGEARRLLQGSELSISTDPVAHELQRKIDLSALLLASSWSSKITTEMQAVFSVHIDRQNQRTILHIGLGGLGSIFLTLPRTLDPEARARLILRTLREELGKILAERSPIAVVDGSCQSLNMQELLPRDALVVRSIGDDVAKLRSNIELTFSRPALSASNTSIVSGLPATPEELAAVFGDASNWDVWNEVATTWSNTVRRNGFALTESAPRDAALNALATSQNVIVLIAHADTNGISFPAPPPDGTKLTHEDIRSIREQISENRPTVYLFCCETAQIPAHVDPMSGAVDVGFRNFANTLLECGASAVVAPQTQIDLDRKGSLALFSQFTAIKSDNPPLVVLRDAKDASNYQEMEVWLA